MCTAVIWSLYTLSCGEKLDLPAPQLANINCSVEDTSILCFDHSYVMQLLAVPVGSEVKVYERSSWKCVFTLSDTAYHTEVSVTLYLRVWYRIYV